MGAAHRHPGELSLEANYPETMPVFVVQMAFSQEDTYRLPKASEALDSLSLVFVWRTCSTRPQ